MLRREAGPSRPMREWAERRGVEPQFIHSGGHAWPEDLRRLVDSVGAKETVWVHTDSVCPATQLPIHNNEG